MEERGARGLPPLLDYLYTHGIGDTGRGTYTPTNENKGRLVGKNWSGTREGAGVCYDPDIVCACVQMSLVKPTTVHD